MTDDSKKKIGLIVNPWAGVGGSVGLKGSDGLETREKAIALGAIPQAGARATIALTTARSKWGDVEVLSCSGAMGYDACSNAQVPCQVVYQTSESSTSEDTRQAARILAELAVDVLLFCGGDGTARDICSAIGDRNIPVIGIPAGVKVYSGVFARSPGSAGELCAAFVQGRTSMEECEVMDLDEQALRNDQVSTKLYGYLHVPQLNGMKQPKKARTLGNDAQYVEAVGCAIIDIMQAGVNYVIGPGSTTYAITQQLDITGTLVGVDVVRDGKLIAKDATEQDLLSICNNQPCKIVVTCIGGQGFLLGRGNQQISAQLIELVGAQHIIAVATPGKLAKLNGNPMLVDTGNAKVDTALAGFIQVHTGYGDKVIYPVACAG